MRDRPNERHRRVAEAKVGRALGPDEIAHHVDEDKANNSDANITVEPRSAHTAAHNRTRHVSRLRKSLRMVREGKKLY
jgi:hypothetical protein